MVRGGITYKGVCTSVSVEGRGGRVPPYKRETWAWSPHRDGKEGDAQGQVTAVCTGMDRASSWRGGVGMTPRGDAARGRHAAAGLDASSRGARRQATIDCGGVGKATPVRYNNATGARRQATATCKGVGMPSLKDIYRYVFVGNGFVPFDCGDTIEDGDHMAVMRSAIVTLVVSLSPFFRT